MRIGRFDLMYLLSFYLDVVLCVFNKDVLDSDVGDVCLVFILFKFFYVVNYRLMNVVDECYYGSD